MLLCTNCRNHNGCAAVTAPSGTGGGENGDWWDADIGQEIEDALLGSPQSGKGTGGVGDGSGEIYRREGVGGWNGNTRKQKYQEMD